MNSEVERFLAEIVDPTIRDFESNPASVRHAFLACLTTFHALDRFEGKRNLRKSFRDELPEFAVVDRVAHAFKHVGTGNHKDENNQPLSDQDLIERSPARCGQARCGLSRLGRSEWRGHYSFGNRKGPPAVSKKGGCFLGRKSRGRSLDTPLAPGRPARPKEGRIWASVARCGDGDAWWALSQRML
jgi:hypothetical protein